MLVLIAKLSVNLNELSVNFYYYTNTHIYTLTHIKTKQKKNIKKHFLDTD